MRRPGAPPAPPHQTTATTPRRGTTAAAAGPPCRSPASSPAAATTPCANSERTRSPPPRKQPEPGRAGAPDTDEPAAGSRQLPARPGYGLGRPRKNERPQPPQPGHPITHHVAGARQNAPRTEIRLGARRAPGELADAAQTSTAGAGRRMPHDLTSSGGPLLPRRAIVPGRPSRRQGRSSGGALHLDPVPSAPMTSADQEARGGPVTEPAR